MMANSSTTSDGAEPSIAYIDIARDFSPTLGFREESLSSFSGEQFLREILRPAFVDHDRVVVALDDIKTYGASFFEESFGGLVREFGLREVEQRVSFVAVRRAHLVPLIQSWMRLAESQRR